MARWVLPNCILSRFIRRVDITVFRGLIAVYRRLNWLSQILSPGKPEAINNISTGTVTLRHVISHAGSRWPIPTILSICFGSHNRFPGILQVAGPSVLALGQPDYRPCHCGYVGQQSIQEQTCLPGKKQSYFHNLTRRTEKCKRCKEMVGFKFIVDLIYKGLFSVTCARGCRKQGIRWGMCK